MSEDMDVLRFYMEKLTLKPVGPEGVKESDFDPPSKICSFCEKQVDLPWIRVIENQRTGAVVCSDCTTEHVKVFIAAEEDWQRQIREIGKK